MHVRGGSPIADDRVEQIHDLLLAGRRAAAASRTVPCTRPVSSRT